jgi:predicted peptidase
MRLSRILVAVGLAFACAAVLPARADDKEKPKTGFVNKTFKNDDGSESPYVVFVPHSYDGTKEMPIILFLHGAGETKNPKAKKEGKKPVEVGIGPAIKTREKTFPFITVIPRAEGFGWGADTANAKRALAMLDATMKEYKTDPKRQILTGLSMGGMGTWSIAAAHPDRWAAIAPICGPGDPATAEKVKDIPCWGFLGTEDSERLATGMRNMITAVEKAGGKPRFTEYKWVGHDSWDPAYATNELYTWMLKQSKK